MSVAEAGQTTSPDPAGVLQVPSHLKNVVAEGVPVAFILAGVTVAASIVQVAPLAVTVISPLSPSDTAPDITISPTPKIEVEFIVFMFVQDTRVSCFTFSAVCVAVDIGNSDTAQSFV